MTDFSFDFDHWLLWRQLLWWSLTIAGLVSALVAFTAYKYSARRNTFLFSILLLAGMLILLGCYPIEWGYSTDRANYAQYFLAFKNGLSKVDFSTEEVGFQLIQYFFSRFLNVTQFMFVISLIYLVNYYIAIRKMVRGNSYWLLIAAVLSMGFVSYNLNTMRAGLAISFVVLALPDYKSLWRLVALLAVAVSIHTSMVIPGAMILICRRFDNTPLFFRLWMISIPLSFVAGGFFNGLFAGMGEDQRTSYLTTTESRYNIGFRIDFILYSLIPVLVGWYYKYRKGFDKDRFYSLVYNAYLLTNIFWILVIRANYSDRFAYLSWFMIPFVLVYPLLKQKMSLREGTWLGMILLGENIFRLFI